MAAVGELMEAVLMQRLHGQEVRNVLHYELVGISGAGGAPDADAANALTMAMESFWGAMRPAVSTELTCYGILVQRVRPLPRTAGFFRVPVNQAGSNAGNALPSSVAVVVRKKTAFAGRKYRGRIYFAGLPVTSEDNSSLSAAAAIVWEGIGDGMEINLAPAPVNGRSYTFAPRLYSKSTGTWIPLTTCAVDTVLRNQRRRQVGKGA